MFSYACLEFVCKDLILPGQLIRSRCSSVVENREIRRIYFLVYSEGKGSCVVFFAISSGGSKGALIPSAPVTFFSISLFSATNGQNYTVDWLTPRSGILTPVCKILDPLLVSIEGENALHFACGPYNS